MHRLALLPFLVLISCLHTVQERPHPHFIDLVHIEDSIAIDMRYAGENNFVGERIDGYRAPRCLLTDNAASALAQVQRELMIGGFSLIVHDCYRPQRAVDHFVQWAQDLSDERTKSHCCGQRVSHTSRLFMYLFVFSGTLKKLVRDRCQHHTDVVTTALS